MTAKNKLRIFEMYLPERDSILSNPWGFLITNEERRPLFAIWADVVTKSEARRLAVSYVKNAGKFTPIWQKTAGKGNEDLLDLTGEDWRQRARAMAGMLLIPCDHAGRKMQDAAPCMYRLDRKNEGVNAITTLTVSTREFMKDLYMRETAEQIGLREMVKDLKGALQGARVRTEAETAREASALIDLAIRNPSMKLAACAAITNKKNSGGANRLHGDQLRGRVTNATRGATAAA